MTVGGVLEQTLGLYQRYFWRFAATTFVVVVFLDFLGALGTTVDSTAGGLLWALISLIVSLVGVFWVQGALTLAVDDVRDGRADTSIGELYGRTRSHLAALIVAGVLAGIGIAIGFLLLIVPGLYLLTRWAVIVPTIVLEGRSAGESFTRSSELTAGHRWTVLWIALITVIASAIIGGLVTEILGAILPDFLGTWIGSVVAHCITTPFLALAWTVVYFELRDAKAEQAPALA